jgi:hypothetical protein
VLKGSEKGKKKGHEPVQYIKGKQFFKLAKIST